MGISTTIAAFLGPIGWVAAGVLSVFGLGKNIQQGAIRKWRRFLGVILYLIAIDERQSQNISPEIDYSSEIDQLWEIIDEQEKTITDLSDQKEKSDQVVTKLNNSIKILSERSKASKTERTSKNLSFPTKQGRTCQINTTGGHHSMWGTTVNDIDDISDPNRKVFAIIMEHKAVERITLGDYIQCSAHKPPYLRHISKKRGSSVWRLYSKGKRANGCEVIFKVKNGAEQSVFDYILENDIMDPKRK